MNYDGFEKYGNVRKLKMIKNSDEEDIQRFLRKLEVIERDRDKNLKWYGRLHIKIEEKVYAVYLVFSLIFGLFYHLIYKKIIFLVYIYYFYCFIEKLLVEKSYPKISINTSYTTWDISDLAPEIYDQVFNIVKFFM